MSKITCTLLTCILLLLSAGICGWADDKESIAGLHLGKSIEDIRGEFATLSHLAPSEAGVMTAQPPIEIRPDTLASGGGAPGGAPAAGSKTPAPNTLIFTNKLTGEEISIGSSTIVYAAGADMAPTTGPATMPSAPQPTMPTMNPGGGGTDTSDSVTLPTWAYLVRANSLRLDQKQLIFRINKVASIGVTFSKTDTGLVATDIVVASFEPLADKDTPLQVSPKTLQGIGLGSTYAQVLRKYGWSPYLYPFSTQSVTETVGAGGGDDPPIQATFWTFVRDPNTGDTVTPIQTVYDIPDPTGTIAMSGTDPVSLTDGKKTMISTGFSDCYLTLYPTQGVAITCIKNKVVRIQVGQSVVVPPDPPKPPTPPVPTMPSGPTTGPITPGGPVTPPTPTPTPTKNPWD